MKRILAWHFIADRTLRFPHNGKENIRIRKGQTLHVKPPLVMCHHGLHASINPLDALGYYDCGEPITVCRVELWGETITGNNKLCAEYRKVLWYADCTKTLHLFACWCAEQALKLVDVPDPRSVAAIEVKRSWIDGKATDNELAAASAAAWVAASSAAAWDAASAAARAAARAAASAAAWDAARDAAWDAAWAAARDAAWDAARDAARAAAWDAAWAAQTKKLIEMLEE